MNLESDLSVDQYGNHSIVIDAHQYDALLKVRTGDYYYLGFSTTTRTGTTALTGDALTALPFYVARAMTFDRATIHVKTQDAGEAVRLGVYNDDGTNLYPGTLVEDFGAASVNSTGVVATTISPARTLQPGLYWLAMLPSATTAEVYLTSLQLSVLGLSPTNFTQPGVGWRKTSVSYGALPDPFTAGAAITVTSGAVPGFFLRPSALA